MSAQIKIGPFRIPKEYKEGLDQLKAGKAHLTMSDLVREAIYLLLCFRGVIEGESTFTTWEKPDE